MVEAAVSGRRAGEGRARWGARGQILSPAAKRRAVDMLTTTLKTSEQLASKAVGLTRSTYRRLPQAQTPADPDATTRACLHGYAREDPRHTVAGHGRRYVTTNAVRSARRNPQVMA